MAPRTIRRRAPRNARVDRIPQPDSEGVNRKVHPKLGQIHRRIVGPRAYTMNVVERFLLPRPEGMGIPPRQSQSVDVLQGYLQMMRRINGNLPRAQALHPNAQYHSPPPQQHRPRANIVASNEDPAAQLQEALVDIYVDSSAMVIPPIRVHHEDDDLEDFVVNDDAEDLAVDDYAEDLAAIDDAIAPPEHGSVSPLLSPIVFSDERYGHAIMSPEIDHSYYDCPLCLSVQASPTDSDDTLGEVEDYEPNLFR